MVLERDYSIIVVMPVYEDLKACKKLLCSLAALYSDEIYAVVVDDGSIVEPLGVELLNECSVHGQVIKLRRNVGHQRAIAIGLEIASKKLKPHQVVAIMDSDGEDPPEMIPILVQQLSDPVYDAISAGRQQRHETLKFKAFYSIYKTLFTLLTGKKINFGNFMVLRASSVMRLVAMQELGIHVAAALLASKLRIKVQPINRQQRYYGASKMSFISLALHGFRALMVFAEDVLVRVGTACAAIVCSSMIGIIIAILLKFVGLTSPGWFSVALGILGLIILQTGALALMTLMMTGIAKNSFITNKSAHNEFIEKIDETQYLT